MVVIDLHHGEYGCICFTGENDNVLACIARPVPAYLPACLFLLARPWQEVQVLSSCLRWIWPLVY